MKAKQLGRTLRWLGLASVLAATGCGTSVYQPAHTAGFELDPVAEINDDDVRKAFDAKPQLPAQVSVAYYTFDDDYAEQIETMLGSLPAVTKSYRIPTLLVTGKRKFDEPGWGPARSTPPLSIKKLRLMAARAHADVLLIFDYGHRVVYSGNGLAAFGILLVPIFFLPMQDVETESYLDTYVIDTKNGYLYGQVSATRDAGEDYLLVYSDRGNELVDGQRSDLVAEAGRLLAALLSRTATAPGAVGGTGSPSGSVPRRADLRLSFGPTGDLYVNGKRFSSLNQARAWLAELVRDRDASAVVRSHEGVPASRMVEVLDLLEAMNVRSVAVERGEAQSVHSGAPAPRPPSSAPPGEPGTALPNPASGNPSPVTPFPTLPPHGSPAPVTPLPVGP